jgi:hypothetical protein
MGGRGTFDSELTRRLKDVPNFQGVAAADELPDPSTMPPDSCFIANYSDRNMNGTHWVAFMHINNKRRPPEFFDSYGFPPGGENNILDTRAPFKHFMEAAAKQAGFGEDNYLYNKINMQCVDSDVCGEYCVFAILQQDLPQNPSTGAIRPQWKPVVNPKATCRQADLLIKKKAGVRPSGGKRR